MTSRVAAPNARKTFSRLKHVLDLPNLIDIQKASFDWFMNEGLRETIDDISPIEDYTGTLAVEFGEYEFGEPQFSIKECREKDLTYQVPLSMTVRFVNKETGEIREQRVFMGDFPDDDGAGHVHHQRHRARDRHAARPLARRLPDGAEGRDEAGLHREPDAEPRLVARARDRQEGRRLRPHRPEAQAADHDAAARAAGRGPVHRLRSSTRPRTRRSSKLFDNSIFIANTLEKDATTREEEALIEVFKKQRPGEPPTLDNARNLLKALFFDPKRYDLTKVGRYKLNQRLGVNVPDDVARADDRGHPRARPRLVSLPHTLGVDLESKDFAADAISMPRAPIAAELDEYEDFGNRRLRTVGELIQEAFRVGLYRMERVVRERMTTEDVDTITPQTIINIRPVVAALKEFFGSSQLSQFMDQTNSLSGLTHRRRLSALGAGGLTRERAPIEVRDVHPTHYGRMCPIETPEGPNIGLIGSLASFATVSEFGFIQTPYRKVDRRQGDRRHRLPGRGRGGAVHDRPGLRAGRREDRQVPARPGALPLAPRRGGHRRAEGRRVHGRRAGADRLGRDGPDPVPRAQRREPRADGREHAAAGRAADDHRPAARRHRPRVPGRGRHRRRDARPSTPARSSTSTPRRSSSSRRRARTSTT